MKSKTKARKVQPVFIPDTLRRYSDLKVIARNRCMRRSFLVAMLLFAAGSIKLREATQ